jgi:hypothetical protein
MASTETHNLIEIRSAVALGKPQVDRAAGIVRGVKVLGRKSPNLTRGLPTGYSDEAIQNGVPLYEGAQVNIDHPDRSTPDAPRSYRDRFGWLQNARAEPDGIYADQHVLKSHALAEQFFEQAERNPAGVGLSHNARGRGKPSGGEFLIEELQSVRSVDVVTDPATTHSLFESRQEAPMLNTSNTPPAAGAAPAAGGTPPAGNLPLVEAKPGDAAKPAGGAESLLEARLLKVEETLKSTTAELDRARVALAARERKDRVEALLLESKLPAFAVTPKFREQLVEAKDDAAVKVLIEDRRAVARGSFHTEPGNAPAPSVDPAAKPIETTEQFLESLRKSGR